MPGSIFIFNVTKPRNLNISFTKFIKKTTNGSSCHKITITELLPFPGTFITDKQIIDKIIYRLEYQSFNKQLIYPFNNL